MSIRNNIVMICVCGVLASCTTRTTYYADPIDAQISANWHVHGVEVEVPDSLTTTEMNTFMPDVDIVWHGDPVGDRRAQVAVILKDALGVAAQRLIPENEHRPVVIQATLIEFHSLTPRARAITGGVHKVKFWIQIVDQKTGVVLAGPSLIEADEFAYGGGKAITAENAGQTMKVRISNRIIDVVRHWLGLEVSGDFLNQDAIMSIGR